MPEPQAENQDPKIYPTGRNHLINPGILRLFVLILVAAGLFGFSVFRAITYPLTHDEALSFTILMGDSYQATTANNHLFNTLLMSLSSQLFGIEELALRLPNILACGLFLASSILIVRRLKHPWMQAAGFIFINFNLFQFDFFFLARGYGLGLGLQLFSVYCLLNANSQPGDARMFRFLYLALLAAGLSVFANFSYLNFFLPLWVVCVWRVISDEINPRPRINKGTLHHLIAFVFIGVTISGLAARELIRLSSNSELYFGGANNILSDTLKSLVEVSLYSASYTQVLLKPIAFIVAGMACLFFLTALLLSFKEKKLQGFQMLALIFAGTVILPILQYYLVNSRFPIERAALYYLPVYAALAAHQFDLIISHVRIRFLQTGTWLTTGLIAFALGVHFISNLNLRSCYNWDYEASNKEVLKIMAMDRELRFPEQTIDLGISWVFEPSLNYYRMRDALTWLYPLDRDGIEPSTHHYIYAFVRDVPEGLADFDEIARFPNTGTVLLRRNR